MSALFPIQVFSGMHCKVRLLTPLSPMRRPLFPLFPTRRLFCVRKMHRCSRGEGKTHKPKPLGLLSDFGRKSFVGSQFEASHTKCRQRQNRLTARKSKDRLL